MLTVPLHRQFRYVHEPLPAGDDAIPTLGHEALVETLRERLTYSYGGTFLITGFRGVGKSTLVLRAVAEAAAERGPRDVLLPVHLNIARRMAPDQLLFAVVRRIFESLDDHGLLEQLPPEVRHSLLLSYARTSLSFTQTQSEGTERGGTVGMGAKKGPLAAVSPSLSLAGKRTSAWATEASFLAYSETDVEHDLGRIVQLLNGEQGRLSRRRRWLRRRSRSRLRVHPVIVLDEVDKLTDNSAEAIGELEKLLSGLKNVLTARGAHFVLVAGPDLHDQALHDAHLGNGLYESVFAWRLYVPCLREAPERLVQGVVDTDVAAIPPTTPAPPDGDPPGMLDTLVDHLRFKSKGVPRRLLQEFNAFVVWDGHGRPVLRLDEDDWLRVQFYSRLQSIVSEAAASGTSSKLVSLPIDEDRWLLGNYHVVDWALRSRGRVFAAEDVIAAGQADPLLRLESGAVDGMLRHLVRAGVLEAVNEVTLTEATIYGNPSDAAITSYRLTDAYGELLAGFARRNESERADLQHSLPSANLPQTPTLTRVSGTSPSPDAAPTPDDSEVSSVAGPRVALLAGRYEALRLIGRGGMGAVYQGRDTHTGEEVAIKLLRGSEAADSTILARFRREAEIGMRLHHPHIGRTIAAVDTPEPALVMELVAGLSLEEHLDRDGVLPPTAAARLGSEVGQALSYMHTQGVSRIDLKPANIILHADRGAVIVDLGLARSLDAPGLGITAAGLLIGTPSYMAPEQARGVTVDIRSDLYSLGVVMYRSLTGELPHPAPDIARMLYAITHEDVRLDGLRTSSGLREVLERCLARDPDDRYQTPDDFLRELGSTPEASSPEAEGR